MDIWEWLRYILTTEVIMMLCWFALLFILGVILRFTVPKAIDRKEGTPEFRAYKLTMRFLWFHVGAGLLLCAVLYFRWFVNKAPEVEFWQCWPVAAAFGVVFLIDVLFIFLVFGPRYAEYKN